MFDFIEKPTGKLFVLNKDGQPERCEDPALWGKWMENTDRRIAHTKVGKFEVVTYFTGEDLSDPEDGGPVLWLTETKPRLDLETDGYPSHTEAIQGHNRAVEMAGTAEQTAVDAVNMMEQAKTKDSKWNS